jgi:hypothetical protein
MIIVIIVFPHFQVVDENSVRYDHVNDDPKYYVVKAESRKDMRRRTIFCTKM